MAVTKQRRPVNRARLVSAADGIDDMASARRVIRALEDRVNDLEQRVVRLENP